MKKVYFKTFGCRTNIYDTQVMKNSLSDFEIVESEDEADIVVVNSCTVTNGADVSVRGYINSIKDKRVYLGGCGAISKGKQLFDNGKVFGVFGHSEKESLNRLLKSDEKFVKIGDLTSLDKSIVENYEGKTKAFIKIQEGCNFRCSYCIIPFVRGDARSQDEDRILLQIEKLASNGYGEFVLTGTNIGSYGKDKGSSLGKLLQRIGKIRGVRRVRLGSIEPIQIDESFKEILNEPWLERHLHIAIQHVDEEMLKLMKRRNSYKRDLELFSELSEMGFALGTDFIIGHPGESDEIWNESLKKIKKLPLTHIHAFTYSKRDATPSAKMKNGVRGDVAKKRLKELEKIIKDKNFNFRKRFSDKALEVLVEERKGEFYTGFDQYYNRVKIKSTRNIEKEWIGIGDYDVLYEGNFAEF